MASLVITIKARTSIVGIAERVFIAAPKEKIRQMIDLICFWTALRRLLIPSNTTGMEIIFNPMTFPPHCSAAKLPSFTSPEAAKAFFAQYCGSGQAIKRIYGCKACGGWHAESEESDETGKRPQTLKIPESAEATGRRLSRRDAERYRNL